MRSKGYTKVFQLLTTQKSEAYEHFPERLVVLKTKEVKKEEQSEAKEKDHTGTNFSATTGMNPIQQTTTGMGPSYPDKNYVINLKDQQKQGTETKQSIADLRQSSSQFESSDSESSKRRENERRNQEKKRKREKDKEEKLNEEIIDIDIIETETFTLLSL